MDDNYVLDSKIWDGVTTTLIEDTATEPEELYDEDVIEYCRNRDTYDKEFISRFWDRALPYIEKMMADDWDFELPDQGLEQPDEGFEQPGEGLEINGE